MSKYEVLAPVGKFSELEMIIAEKPDAIYVGIKGMTSRPSRTDFSVEEIVKTVDICHKSLIKVYVAINSVISGKDLSEIVDIICDLDKKGVDAFIIADYGLMFLLSEKSINAELHASTLLGVYNVETVGILKKLGVKRVIFYANLYIDEMTKIINAYPELEYELVAEGGTCFNDIRQCRLPHIITETEHKLTCRQGCILYNDANIPVKGKLLAEHPTRAAEIVGIYMAVGITSFKIEGRTVPACERIQVIRDLKNYISKFDKGQPLKSYLHYINRIRREML